jgi:hypothetical protein
MLAPRGDLGAGLWQDTLVLGGAGLTVEAFTVVHKPTATVAAEGGTQTLAVATELRSRLALPIERARLIVAACIRAVPWPGSAAEFELTPPRRYEYLMARRRR